MGQLEGKVALVTGAASGIGRATAAKLGAEGATVVLADIDEAGGKAAATAQQGGHFRRLDVGDPEAWMALCEEIQRSFGGLDCAHLNAGISIHSADREPEPSDSPFLPAFDLAEMLDGDYRRLFSVNVDGVILGARAVLPTMVAGGGGAIVATASIAGLIGFAPDPIYTATKHAVVGFVRSMAPLLAPHEITINALCPGVVDTNILGPDGADRARAAGIPVIPPEAIADAVLDIVTGGRTGESIVCLAGQAPTAHVFTPLTGVGPEIDQD